MEDVNKRRRNFFLFLNLSGVARKLTPGKFAYNRHFQRTGINATKLEKTPIKSDVFAAVAVVVVDAKSPYSLPPRSECLFYTQHHGVAQNLSDMWRPSFEIGAAQIRCVTEITLKSPLLHVCVSSRHEKLSWIVWTATVQNCNKSFTHIEHRAGAVGRGLIIGNLSTRRSWFTNCMAGRAELDRGRGLRAKCKSLSKTTWNHHERRENNSVENVLR